MVDTLYFTGARTVTNNPIGMSAVKRTISDIHLFWPQYNEGLKFDDGSASNKKRNALKCKYVIDTVTRSNSVASGGLLGSGGSNNDLGNGHFSKVKRCQNLITQRYYAMKLIDKKLIKNEKLKLVSREINLLKLVSEKIRLLESNGVHLHSSNVHSASTFVGHHHILQLMDYFETQDNIALVTQLCSKNDLYEVIIENECLPYNDVRQYTACLLSCLSFLHDNNIVHRDLKAENVFFRLNKSTSKNSSSSIPSAHDIILGDFGLATTIDNNLISSTNSLKEYVGTMSYIAPEIVTCKNVNSMSSDELANLKNYGLPVDVWSLGVLVYFMNFGYMPFDCDTEDETLDCIMKCDYYIDQDSLKDINYKCFWNFLKLCFTFDQNERPSAKSLQSHPFIDQFFKISNNNTEVANTNIYHDDNIFDIRNNLFKDDDFFMKRKSSTTSLHSLKSPKKSTSSSSLNSFNYDFMNSSISNFTTPLNSASSNNKQSNILYSNNAGHPTFNIPLSMDQQQHQSRNKMSQLNIRRESLKKTLSMTSIKKNQSQKSSNYHADSTFILDPKPPVQSLMNGCYSLMPETRNKYDKDLIEDFEIPRSLSRPNSSSDMQFFANNNDLNDTNDLNYIQNSNNSINNIDINVALKNILSQTSIDGNKSSTSVQHLLHNTNRKPTFSLGGGDDDDDDDNED